MDFIPGDALEKMGHTLNKEFKQAITKQDAQSIQDLQSTPVSQSNLGPVVGRDDEP